jgi:hypothetical protein
LNGGFWSEEETARLKEFVARGASLLRVAAALNRKMASVRTQAHKIGTPFPNQREARKKLTGTSSKP